MRTQNYPYHNKSGLLHYTQIWWESKSKVTVGVSVKTRSCWGAGRAAYRGNGISFGVPENHKMPVWWLFGTTLSHNRLVNQNYTLLFEKVNGRQFVFEICPYILIIFFIILPIILRNEFNQRIDWLTDWLILCYHLKFVDLGKLCRDGTTGIGTPGFCIHWLESKYLMGN